MPEGVTVALPTDREVSAWLRRHVRKKPPGPVARLLGEPPSFRYQVSQPTPRENFFFRRHALFHVHGETGLLPLVSLPHGSWGIFSTNGLDLSLLRPGDGSLSELLRRERRPLEEASPAELAQLVCDALLARKPAHRHVLVESPAQLADPHFVELGTPGTYVVDERQLQRVTGDVRAPSLEADGAGGFRLRFTTAWGWMHDVRELGSEEVTISNDFELHVADRKVLAKRIFRKVPDLRY